MRPIFILPYHKIGGADKIHLEIIKSINCKPIVLFNNLGKNDSCGEFETVAICLKINSKKRKKAVIKILKLLSIFFKIKLFGCNSFFYYEVISELKNRTYNIDLTHAFSYPDVGIENYTLPVVQNLHKRIVINSRTLNDYKKLYEQNGIDIKLLSRFQIIENGLVIKEFDELCINKRFKKFKIGFVGRNAPEKRPELFFDIVKKLKIEAKAIGDNFEIYKNDFPDVEYFENCNKSEIIREQFSDISILIVPSYREGFPLVIMEAMELGIPVIATPVGNIHEHLMDGFNGYLSQTAEAIDFFSFCSKRIIDVKNDYALYHKISLNARKYSEQNFDISSFKKKYIELFSEKGIMK